MLSVKTLLLKSSLSRKFFSNHAWKRNFIVIIFPWTLSKNYVFLRNFGRMTFGRAIYLNLFSREILLKWCLAGKFILNDDFMINFTKIIFNDKSIIIQIIHHRKYIFRVHLIKMTFFKVIDLKWHFLSDQLLLEDDFKGNFSKMTFFLDIIIEMMFVKEISTSLTFDKEHSPKVRLNDDFEGIVPKNFGKILSNDKKSFGKDFERNFTWVLFKHEFR